MKDNLIWIYTLDAPLNKVIKKFYEMNIEFYKTKNIDSKDILLVKETDYVKLKKYCRFNFLIYEFFGIKKIKNKLNKSCIFILIVFFGILCIFFFSNIIVNVEIIHSKEEIRNLLKDELEDYGIKRLSLRKDFQKISEIKDKVLKNNKDKIEWLEIEPKGMSYIVRVEERLILKDLGTNDYCHVIAKKDGQILEFTIEKGLANIKKASYVKKGDILISGDILLNEEIVDNVCAKGKVEAEVWYTINIEMPLCYENIQKTGKTRFNFMFLSNNKENVIFKSRIKEKVVSNKKIFSILGNDFYLQKEDEIKKTQKKYTDEEVINVAVSTGLEKLNVTLDSNAKIISQKVLKKSIKDSKIYLELFVCVKEEIGVIQKIN